MTSPQPIRIRLSRRRGFDLQALSRETNGLPALVVARPGPFGNPFVVGKDGDREQCVHFHRHVLVGLFALTKVPRSELEACRSNFTTRWRDLRGHNLACWCGSGPCHADNLLDAIRIMEGEE